MNAISRSIRYCEGVMESVWLAAVVCTPLFFNIRGESVESDKNFLLRSLGTVLLAAWAAKAVFFADGFSHWRESLGNSWRALRNTPLALAAALLALILLISTVLSLSPGVSFWGATARRLGSSTYFCCLLFFAALTTTIRSEQQVSRIITLAILTSLPVSLYGIGQRFAIDPIIWMSGPTVARVGSTFAHAIYLGAYLMMIVPLTLSRVLMHYLASRADSAQRTSHLGQAVIYALTASTQLGAMICTVSRGPVVGLIAGSAVMILLLAVYWRKRWLVVGMLTVGLVLPAGLVLLAWPNGPFRTLASRYEVQRFSELLNPKQGSAGERAAAWQVAAQAARFSAIVEVGQGRKDPVAGLRFLFGYGPENVGPVGRLYSLREFNAVLPDHILFDRFHSNFWDTLITTGIIGLATYFAMTFLVIYGACRWLGRVVTPWQKTVFWGLFLGGGLVCTLALVSWQGLGFTGVGVRLGTSLGLLAWLVWIAWRNEFDSAPRGIPVGRALTMIALLAGVVAHLIEIEFSFFVETTLLHFFIYAALLLVLGQRLPALEAEAARSVSDNAESRSEKSASGSTGYQPVPSGNLPDGTGAASMTNPGAGFLATPMASVRRLCSAWRVEIAGGLILGLFLVNLGFMLIQKTEPNSTIRTLVNALTRLPGYGDAFTWSLLFAIALISLTFAAVWMNEAGNVAFTRDWLLSLTRIWVVSGAIALVCWLALAYQTAFMMPFTLVRIDNLGQFLADRLVILDLHYLATFVLILLLAPFVADTKSKRWVVSNGLAGLKYVTAFALAVAAAATVYATNMNWSKAGLLDKLCKEDYLQRPEQWPITAAIHEAALKSLPRADTHYLALGKLLLDQAAATPDADRQQALFTKADGVLETGGKWKPLDPAFPVRRGNLYLKWALAAPTAEKKTALGRKALEFYQQGVARDPGNPTIWNNMAYVQLVVFNAPDESYRLLLRSVELHPGSHPALGLLGDVLFRKGLSTPNSVDQKTLFERAVTNYQRAITLVETNSPETSYKYLVGLGKPLVKLGQLTRAITNYQNALNVSPPAERWRNEEMLARLRTDLNDKTNALAHLQRALELAPEDKRPGLLGLRQEILARP